ncbi:ABC transporter ATP-binding protein [Aminobacter sp. AP02]|uniref:ABC transporter ATP-binding protein n=1 Tax=Aminobacter sp. AP02 TaxID=2135737 RepID=UPI000D6BDDC7|nr:ABC transporter ATP-binding protein [Aminobacter sp. AP02]PWK61788.1 branched-chain amino acid transport system ATP-binding protein [Aminobacter sp. AP02]
MQTGFSINGSVHSDMPLIEVRGLVKQFGGLRAIDGMSMALKRGEMVGLIGPNGAGKTTMFNLIAGALKPTSGAIRIGDADVSGEGAEQRIGRGVGRTFQIPRPFAEMTVLENVLTGAQGQSGERFWMNFLSTRKVAAEERAAVEKARALLDFVLLAKLQNEPARVLSGGQRKLLELARILMADPDVILLDEPAAGVNPTLLELIIDRVRALNGQGKTILLIEHNMEMVARLCGRVIVMAAGKLLAEGTPAEVSRHPAVVSAYLGGVA